MAGKVIKGKIISAQALKERKRRAKIIIRELKKLIPDAKLALHYSNPWELTVAVVLSAQCTDKKVNEVTEKLFKKYRKLDDYVKAKPAGIRTGYKADRILSQQGQKYSCRG